MYLAERIGSLLFSDELNLIKLSEIGCFDGPSYGSLCCSGGDLLLYVDIQFDYNITKF